MRTIESLGASEYTRNLTEKLEIENKNLKDRIAADRICLDYLAEEVVFLRKAAKIASELESLINAQSPPNYRQDNTPTTPVEKLQWILDRFSALREDKARLEKELADFKEYHDQTLDEWSERC